MPVLLGILGLTTVREAQVEGTQQVRPSPVPNVVLDPARESLISSSGALLLREAIRIAGLDRQLSAALSPWRPDRAVHDPGKVLLDVATAVALGGDCLADLAAVRAQPAVFGSVASDPTGDATVHRAGSRCRHHGGRDS
ncbi:MAG: transposase [Nocardioides sp.]